MMTPLHQRLASMDAAAIVEELSVAIYEPPLSESREQLRGLPEALRIPMLVIDFDTEVSMNGILGFLENSTGRYFRETIDACKTIGARKPARILAKIEKIMSRHGVTTERLRDNLAGLGEHTVITFAEAHGNSLEAMTDEITDAADDLETDSDDAGAIRPLLERFIERNREELRQALQELGA